MGKGSRYRTYTSPQFRRNYDKAFKRVRIKLDGTKEVKVVKPK